MKPKIFFTLVSLCLIAYVLLSQELREIISLVHLIGLRTKIEYVLGQSPILFTLTFFLFFLVCSSLSLPVSAVLTIASGTFFGFLGGLLVASFASSLGASIAFLLSKRYFGEFVRKKYGHMAYEMDRKIERDGFFYLFGLRMLLVLPFFVLNVLMGLTKIKLKTFYFATQAGMLGPLALFVFAGTGLNEVMSITDLLKPDLIVSFVVLGFFPLITKKIGSYLFSGYSSKKKKNA